MEDLGKQILKNDSDYPEDLILLRLVRFTYERKTTAILNNYQTKLKPLPENPRITSHEDFFI